MNTPVRKAGRPEVPAHLHKRNRPISMTDAEHQVLLSLAEKSGLGVSAYVIKQLKLAQ